jgi:hypothetical protein
MQRSGYLHAGLPLLSTRQDALLERGAELPRTGVWARTPVAKPVPSFVR